MSNASRCYPVAKSHQSHQGSQREQLQTLVTFSGAACVFSNQLPHVVWLIVASQCFQIPSVAKFPTSFSSIVVSQRTGIQHSQCMQLRMLLEQR